MHDHRDVCVKKSKSSYYLILSAFNRVILVYGLVMTAANYYVIL